MEESFVYQREEWKKLLLFTFYTECPLASLLPGMWQAFSAGGSSGRPGSLPHLIINGLEEGTMMGPG